VTRWAHEGDRTGYDTACFRRLTRKSVAVVYDGRDLLGRRRADVAWRHERICLDCERLRSMGLPHLLAVTGWG
jgi:hypothetical protein